MTDTTISDAVCFPQDDGTGVSDGSEDYNSAGYLALLSKYSGDGSYVGEDTTGAATLQFANVDTTNEQVDVQTGYAYISEGSNTVQSGSQTTYDTTLPVDMPYVVILPSTVVDLGLGTDTSNDLWLAVDPTANDSVYIRHGSGLSAPTDPNVKLGTVDTSTGDTTRANDLRSTTFKSVDTDSATVNGSLSADELTGDSGVLSSRVPPWVGRIEDYERQTTSYYDLPNGGVGITTSTSIQGQASLESTDGAVNGQVLSPFNVSRGYRLTHYIKFDASTDLQEAYSAISQSETDYVSSGDGYEFIVQRNPDDFAIREHDGGTTSRIADSAPSISTGQWLVHKIDIGFSSITSTLEKLDGTEIKSINASNSTFRDDGYFQMELRNDTSGERAYSGLLQRRPL